VVEVNKTGCTFKPMGGATTGATPSVFPNDTSANLSGVICIGNASLCASFGYTVPSNPVPLNLGPVHSGSAWATFQMGWQCTGTADILTPENQTTG
jgi:hypothetical protein